MMKTMLHTRRTRPTLPQLHTFTCLSALVTLTFGLLGATLSTLPMNAAQSSGIVENVVNAPVASNGNVAGAVTDIVINLDRSLDPSVAGRGLAAGNQIRITLPDDFINTGLPIAHQFTGCAPNCSVPILLQGWPQHPVGLFSGAPGVGEWTAFGQGTHTIVIEALEEIVPAPPVEPGIKQIHLLLRGFRNPGPGTYDIQVEAETGPEGAVETGTARVRILPRTRPFLSTSSVFNGPPNPNTIYQETGTMSATPLPFDLLIWNSLGLPMTGASIRGPRFGPSSAATRLTQGGRTVGDVSVVGPKGASGYQVLTNAPSVEINSPVTGVPTARLPVFFRTGDLPGLYTITLSLAGGNSMTFFVNAVE